MLLKLDDVVKLPTLREWVGRDRASIIASRVATVETEERQHADKLIQN